MNKINENKPGYKKTKVGWIPEDWNAAPFKKIAKIQEGQVSPLSKPYCNYRHIGPENIVEGTGHLINIQTAKELGLKSGKYAFDEEAIVYSKIRPNLNKVCLPRFPGICSADAYPIWTNDAEMLTEYLLYFMLSPFFVKQAVQCSMRTGMPKINRPDLNQLTIVSPSLSEQKKIAEILSTWDNAIQAQEKLITQKRKLKRFFMNALLRGRKRFEGKSASQDTAFPNDWEVKRSEEVFRNISIKKSENLPVLSVTQDQGIVLRKDLDRKINMTDENTNTYKVVESGDFVISLRSFQGGLEYSKISGVVSPAYHVIRAKIRICDEFYKYYFKSYYFIEHLSAAVIGIRDGKQISFGDFSFLKVPLPPLEEQKKIANCLLALDREIKLLEKKRDALKIQKKGLMQQLLTGAIRVQANEVST